MTTGLPPARDPTRPVNRDRVELVSADDAAAELAPSWRSLADACRAGPFSRPDFALGWWRHLGTGRLQVATVHRGGTLVALAPLHERRYGPLRVGRFLGHGLGSVSECLVRPGHEDAATQIWSAVQDGGRVLQLVEYRQGGGGLPALCGDPRWAVRVALHDRCPVIDLVGGGADGLLAQPGRRNIRRTVRTARRHLAAAGLVHTVEVVDDPERLGQVLPEITAVYDAAEQARPRQHLLRPPWRAFTTGYLAAAVARHEAHVALGRLDGRAISFDVVLRTGPVMHTWIGRFHPVARRFSPGHLLQYAHVDWASAHGVDRIDLLLGDAAYKLHWTSGGYSTVTLTSCRPGARALVAPALGAVEAAAVWKTRMRSWHGLHRR